jgi:hypothetical protein
MLKKANIGTGCRRGYWPPGLYEDEHGYVFDGKIDAETFGAATASLGCRPWCQRKLRTTFTTSGRSCSQLQV